MPRGSKKGRLTGAARKEINHKRVMDAMDGKVADVVFGRITRILGANHVRVAIATSTGEPVDVSARIPNIFARKGATPITVRDVVTIYVGADFNPDRKHEYAQAHFDITSVLTSKQAHSLWKEDRIPRWMFHDEGASAAAKPADEDGFEFDYAGVPEEGESEHESDSSAPKGGAGDSHKYVDDDLDVDAI